MAIKLSSQEPEPEISKRLRPELIELVKGRKYCVYLYPTTKLIEATYLGEGSVKSLGNNHIFYNKTSYIFVDKYHIENEKIEELDKEVITHESISSHPIFKIRKDKNSLSKYKGLTQLIKQLEEVKA